MEREDWKQDGMDQVLVSRGGERACLGCIHSLAFGVLQGACGLEGRLRPGPLRTHPRTRRLGPRETKGRVR